MPVGFISANTSASTQSQRSQHLIMPLLQVRMWTAWCRLTWTHWPARVSSFGTCVAHKRCTWSDFYTSTSKDPLFIFLTVLGVPTWHKKIISITKGDTFSNYCPHCNFITKKLGYDPVFSFFQYQYPNLNHWTFLNFPVAFTSLHCHSLLTLCFEYHLNCRIMINHYWPKDPPSSPTRGKTETLAVLQPNMNARVCTADIHGLSYIYHFSNTRTWSVIIAFSVWTVLLTLCETIIRQCKRTKTDSIIIWDLLN